MSPDFSSKFTPSRRTVLQASLATALTAVAGPGKAATPFFKLYMMIPNNQPARMVWGTGDQLFDVKWAEWLHATLPHSRGIRRVEGAKLFFAEEMPDLIAEEARALWGVG